jgi:hypothetical protein
MHEVREGKRAGHSSFRTFTTQAGSKSQAESMAGLVDRDEPCLDGIRRILAAHHGFTPEELDFIINYDIKYRVGRDTEVDDE